MADGVTDHENIITIGFLNDQVSPPYLLMRLIMFSSYSLTACVWSPQVEERKESYVNSFDIVLVKDETLDVPNAILRYITSAGRSGK